ncbi:NEDD4-binding protein 2 [Rhynchocyon petersi]
MHTGQETCLKDLAFAVVMCDEEGPGLRRRGPAPFVRDSRRISSSLQRKEPTAHCPARPLSSDVFARCPISGAVESAMDSILELSTTDAKKENTSSNSSLACEAQEGIEGSETVEKCLDKDSEDSQVDSVLDILITQEFDNLLQNAFETIESSSGQIYLSCPLQDVNNLSDLSECINSDSSSSCPVLSAQNQDLTSDISENSASAFSSNSLNSQSISNECQSFLKHDVQALEDPLLNDPLNLTNDSIVGYSCLSGTQEEFLASECVETQSSQTTVDLDASEPQVPLNISAQNPQLDLTDANGDKNSFYPYMLVPSDRFTVKLHTPTELSHRRKDVNYCPVLTYIPVLLPPYTTSLLWNPAVNTFCLFDGNHGFVTPVVTTAAPWNPVNYMFQTQAISQPFQISTYKNKDGTSAYQVQECPVSPALRKKRKSYVGLVLILLRGLPGSGKSFLARALRDDNPSGVIFSTDDYFYINGQYQFDVKYLKEAHEWNEQRAKEAFEGKVSPIIIDNTNLQAWEMKPYVVLSQKHKYKVIFREPETWWKFKPKELARRTIHGISKEKLARMLEHYQRFVSVPVIMSSSVPDKAACIELCPYSCEDKCASLNGSEDTISAKEENVLCLPPKHLEEKTLEVTDESVLLKNASVFHVDLDKRRKGKKRKKQSGMSNNSQCASVQESPHKPFSDSSSKIQVIDKSGKEERVELTPGKQHCKTDIDDSVERVSSSVPCDERNQEDSNLANNELFKNEKPLPCKVPEEKTTVKKKASRRGKGKKNGKKFLRYELSNIFGDWPIVTKTVSQRKKKHRKASSGQSDKKYNLCQSLKELDESLSLDVNCIEQQRSSQDSLGDKKKSQHDNASEFFSSCEDEIFTKMEERILDTSNIVGDWPSTESLAQRQPSSRLLKVHFNEPDLQFGINDSMNEKPLYTCWGTSPEELKTVGCSASCDSEMVSSEMSLSSKICLSERNHGQQPLCHSDTSSLSVVTRVVEPQLLDEFVGGAQEVSEIETDISTQTEPQDFALLWKIEKNAIIVSDSVRILMGRVDGFIPESLKSNTNPDVEEPVPCRMMHDKSTYIEESEFMDADELENFNILCKIFGSISSTVLRILYERCNRDIIWTTSLLLDSEHKLWEAMVVNNFQIVSDESQTRPFSLGLELKEIISPRETFEDAHYSVPECKHKIDISNITTQPTHDGKMENTEKAEIQAFTPYVVGDWKKNEPLPNSHGSFSGLHSGRLSYASVLESSNIMKDLNETEKHPIATTTEHSMHSSLNLSGILNPTSSTSHLGLNEDIYFTDPLEMERNKNHSKDSAEFQIHIEEFMDEDGQKRETIQVVGSSLSAGVRDSDKTEKLNPTPLWAEHPSKNCLELTLPPKVARQLCELFGSVGINIGSLKEEDCVVNVDLSLAKAIHEKWKESVMVIKLLLITVSVPYEIKWFSKQEGVSEFDKEMYWHKDYKNDLEHGRDYPSLVGFDKPIHEPSRGIDEKLLKITATSEMLPRVDHWNVQNKKVSLREIMSEEIAIQEKENLKRASLTFEKDSATKLKEKQLFEQFPTINQDFLTDILQDHNYCLEQTQQFLNCVFDGEPVETVVAQDSVLPNERASLHTPEKSKEKKSRRSRETKETACKSSQDYDYPVCDDYRAEPFFYQQKRMQCYTNAKEAYQMDRKTVTSSYAQQGDQHEKMKEANHLAAMETFEKVNSTLLPQNVLDLHGLCVHEAIAQLMAVLQRKNEEFKQKSNGKPYLSVITGRGNHSQGGVAHIKPAVSNYLTSHGFRFSEIKPGCLKVMLKLTKHL